MADQPAALTAESLGVVEVSAVGHLQAPAVVLAGVGERQVDGLDGHVEEADAAEFDVDTALVIDREIGPVLEFAVVEGVLYGRNRLFKVEQIFVCSLLAIWEETPTHRVVLVDDQLGFVVLHVHLACAGRVGGLGALDVVHPDLALGNAKEIKRCL